MVLPLSFLNISLSLSHCINVILHKYSSATDIIVLTSAGTRVDAPVVRTDGRGGIFSTFLNSPLPRFYIVESETSEAPSQIWNPFIENYSHKFFHPSAKYIFIGKHFSLTYVETVRESNLYDSIFLSRETERIYTFFPYGKEKFKWMNTELLRIGDCRNISTDDQNLFPPKFPEKLENHDFLVYYNRHPVYASCIECSRPGIEIEIFKVILNYSKMKYIFQEIKMDDGVIETTVHFVLIGSSIPVDLFAVLHTKSYAEDSVKWFVPTPQKFGRWRYIFLVFNPSVWLFCVIALLATIVAFILVKSTKLYSINVDTTQFILLIFTGRTKRFKRKDVVLEFLIFSMIFMAFMVNNLFSSRLTFLLNGINFERRIENIQDIINSGLIIGTSGKFYENMVKEMPEFRNYSQENFKICGGSSECFYRAATYSNIAFFLPVREIRLLKYKSNKTVVGLINYRELDQSYFTTKIDGVFGSGDPFFPKINKFIQYLIESGITQRIVKKYFVPVIKEPNEEPTRSLKFEHIVSPLCILAVGLTLSLISFLYELSI